MNSIRKLYCRAFQLVFRIALPFLPYREPKLLEGVQGVAELLARKKRQPGAAGHRQGASAATA